jgi:hypothetical protein
VIERGGLKKLNIVYKNIIVKTAAELKFDRIIKEGFQEILKPLGFKKKGNNFYLQLSELGQIINIQKSIHYSKEQIHFTINTGLFIPEYWLTFYNFHDGTLPKFPTEPECLVRKRIGELRNQKDTWYDITEATDENGMISEMKENLELFILPHFNRLKNRNEFLELIETENLLSGVFEKLIIYGEFKLFDKAQNEYDKLLMEKQNPNRLASLKEYGQEYGLNMSSS